MKSQVLADFIAECTLSGSEDDLNEQLEQSSSGPSWILHVDGVSNAGRSETSLILIDSDRVVAEYALRFAFPASNNQTEYEALLAGLQIAKDLAIRLRVFTDSQLIAGQATGKFGAKDPIMAKYLYKLQALRLDFEHLEVSDIPRKENARTDALSHLATSDYDQLGQIFIEHLETPSINRDEDSAEMQQINKEPSWMDLIVDYLTKGVLPIDPIAAKQLRQLATQYVLLDGALYKRSFPLPLLKCLCPTEADHALQEVHEGLYGNHLGDRLLAYKILRQEYYWPTMQKDTTSYVRKCDQYQ